MLISFLWASMATWFTPTVLFCVLNLMIGTIFIASNFNSPQDHPHDSPGQLAPPPSMLQRVKSVKFSNFYTTPESQHNTDYNSPGQLVRNPSFLERVKSIDLSFASFYASESDQPHHDSPLARAPSMLERVKSIKLSSFYSQNDDPSPTESEQLNDSPGQLSRTPSMLERVKSIKLSSFYSQNDDPSPTESEQLNDSPGQLARAPSFLDRVKSFKISPFKSESELSGPDPHHEPTHNVNRSKSDKSPAKKTTGKMKKSRSEKWVAAADGGQDFQEDVDRRRPATTRETGTASFGSPEDDSVDSKADDFINRFKQQLKLQRLDSILRYKEMLNRGT